MTGRRILLGGSALARLVGPLREAGGRIELVIDAEALLDALEDQEFDLVMLDLDDAALDALRSVQLYRFLAPDVAPPEFVGVAEQCAPEDMLACREAGLEVCLTAAPSPPPRRRPARRADAAGRRPAAPCA